MAYISPEGSMSVFLLKKSGYWTYSGAPQPATKNKAVGSPLLAEGPFS